MNIAQLFSLVIATTLGATLALTGCKSKSRKVTVPFSAENMVAGDTPEADYTHPNYRFKIGGLDNKWNILPPGEIENIVPDASAGAMRVGGVHGAVIVEPVGEVDPGDYMDLLLGSMETMMAGMEIISVDDIRHDGRDAKRAEIDSVVNGVPFRYRSVVFVHQGHGYQLLSWYAKKGNADTGAVQEFIDAVEIVEGEVTPPPVVAIKDFDGVGRRVRSGRFESPIYRLAAKASDGWAIMSEMEALRTNDSAELGMMHAGTGCYLVVIPERLTSTTFEDYRKQTEEEVELAYAEMGDVTKGDSVSFPFAGEDLEFQTRIVGTTLPTRMYFALKFREGIAYQVQAWHFEQKSGDFSDMISNGIRGIEFLGEREAGKIEAALAAAPDPQAAVGPGFSLRNGTYRNFNSEVVWHKPQGIWRISTGDEAALANPDVLLAAENVASGLYLQLISEPVSGFAADEFHDLILSNYSDPDGYESLTQLPEFKLDGKPAKAATFSQVNRAGTIEFRVVTTVRDKHAHQILAWGTAEDMKESSAVVDDAIRGFRFPGSKLEETEQGANWYRDNRTGFEIRVPGTGWRMRENVQPMFEPIGNSVQFMNRNGMVMLIALHIPDNRNAEQTMNNLIQNLLKVNFDRSSKKGATERKTTIGGRPANVTEVESEGEHMAAASFSNRGTIFLMMVGAKNKSEATKLFSSVQGSLKLLP